jgi:hypothetical protein
MWFKGASQFYANGRIPKEMRENSVIFAENESFTQVHSYIKLTQVAKNHFAFATALLWHYSFEIT